MKAHGLSAILLVLILFICLPAPGISAAEAAAATSGSCGETARWSYNPRTGALTVSGTGTAVCPDTDDYKSLKESAVSVTVSEGITALGTGLFSGFRQVTEIALPDSLRTLERESVTNCPKVTALRIPAGVTAIGTKQFLDMESLAAFTVSADNTAYRAEDGVLYSADGRVLVSYPRRRPGDAFTLPDSVREIGDYAFSRCLLKQVTFPPGLERIGTRCFQPSVYLQEVSLPDSVRIVGELAFYGCDNLRAVHLGSGIQRIMRNAFANCRNLTVFETGADFPDTAIGAGVLLNTPFCTAHTEHGAFILEGVLISMDAEQNTDKNGSLRIPDGVTRIANHVFTNQDCVYEVVIPESCTVQNHAFFDYNYEANPDTPGRGSYRAVYICRNLRRIRVLGALRQQGDILSEDAKRVLKEIVPEVSVEVPRAVPKTGYRGIPALRARRERVQLPAGTVPSSSSLAVWKMDGNYSTVDTYNNGFSRDTVQEMCAPDGRIYAAVSGEKTGTAWLVPQSPGGKPVPFRCPGTPGFTLGAATIGGDGKLYGFWARQLSDEEAAAGTPNLRVIQYTTEGRALAECALNPQIFQLYTASRPFVGGNAQLGWMNGTLLILFDTETPKNARGNRHQLSVAAALRTDTMELIAHSDFEGSHSFGLCMVPTDYGFAAIQLDDATNRGFNFNSYGIDSAGNVTFSLLNTNAQTVLFYASGTYDLNKQVDVHTASNNRTYTHFGGFAVNATTCAVAGKATRLFYPEPREMDTALLEKAQYDVFVKLTDSSILGDSDNLGGEDRRNALTGEVADRHVLWLTECTETEKAGQVKIVTLEDGAYCVLWERWSGGEFRSVRCAVVDEQCGIVLPETEIAGARLSGTSVQPIVQDGQLTWAVTDAETDELNWYSVRIAPVELDINGDGGLSIADAVFYGRYLSEDRTLDGQAWDLDGDSLITGFDNAALLREIAKQPAPEA